jgi:hypothetical protein
MRRTKTVPNQAALGESEVRGFPGVAIVDDFRPGFFCGYDMLLKIGRRPTGFPVRPAQARRPANTTGGNMPPFFVPISPRSPTPLEAMPSASGLRLSGRLQNGDDVLRGDSATKLYLVDQES